MSAKRLVVGWCLVWLWGILAFLDIQVTAAQDNQPLDIRLVLSRLEAKNGETIPATLVLQNSSSFTVTNVIVAFQDGVFTAQASNIPDTLPPFSGVQVQYDLVSSEIGTHQAALVVSYEWIETAGTRQHLETISEKLIIVPSWSFDWPGFLIPLLAGAAITLFVSWYTDRRKEKQENNLRQQQAKGIVIALLQAANKNIHWPNPNPVDFKLWEEVVIKGHLFPALNQLGRNIGKPELSRELVELSVSLADYNKRQASFNLTDSYVDELQGRIKAVIVTLSIER